MVIISHFICEGTATLGAEAHVLRDSASCLINRATFLVFSHLKPWFLDALSLISV